MVIVSTVLTKRIELYNIRIKSSGFFWFSIFSRFDMSSGKDEFEQKIAYAQQNWIQFEHGRFYLFFRIAPIMLGHWICVCPNLSQTNRDDIFPPNVKNALSTLNGMIKCHCNSREEKNAQKYIRCNEGASYFYLSRLFFLCSVPSMEKANKR